MNLKNLNYGVIFILLIMLIYTKNITYLFLMIPFILGAWTKTSKK